MKKGVSPITDFFKKVWLLMRCLFTSLSFCALFAGIAIIKSTYGIYIVIASSVLLIFCIYANIILPVSRIPKRKR